MRQIAISDIHGCVRTFEALIDKIGLTKEDELYLLGDYIDRGPDSKGVIDRILTLKEEAYTVNCLLGNHEQMMIMSREDDSWNDTWIFNGGWATLDSFDVEDASEITDPYLHFVRHLPYYFEVGNYLLVHAGLNFLSPNPLQDENSMIWIRGWHEQLDREWLGERVIIHGHTPVPRDNIRQQLALLEQQPVLDIDCGCVFKRKGHEIGYLCAFDMTNKELIFHKNVEEPGA